MHQFPNNHGFVLPLVIVLLLSLLLLFTVLLNAASGLNPVLSRYKVEFEKFYKAESAVLLHLQGYPSGYYPELPRIQTESFGPWEKIEVPNSKLRLIAGTEPRDVSFSDWATCISNYSVSLEKRIVRETSEKTLNGNRRFFHGTPFMSGIIHQGDLELNFSDSVQRANFWVEGSALIRGHAFFDTLRLYALGDVLIQGDVSVGYLELFSKSNFRAEGNVKFRGIGIASTFQMRNHAEGLFPSVVAALGTGTSHGEIIGKAKINGTAEVPGGFLNVVDSTNFKRTILPAFVDGSRKIWGRL